MTSGRPLSYHLEELALISAEGLEAAVIRLEQLLADSNASEDDFQQLFEEHPVVLETLGYVRWTAKPRLPLEGERRYEPDFLAERHDSRVEIIDLKTPYERLVISPNRRERFTAKVNEYVAQVHEYDEYFEDHENRQRCEELHGFVVAKHPPKLIIVGRDEDTDKWAVWRQLDRLASSLSIITYDDVRAALLREHAKLTLAPESLAGSSFLAHIEFSRLNVRRRKYLLDLMGDAGNRLSIYLDEDDRLSLEVTTASGERLIAPTVEQPGRFEIGPPLLLQFDVGSNRDLGILQIRIEDRVTAELRIPGVDLQLEPAFSRGVLGNNIDYTAGGAFALRELMWYSVPLNFRDRYRLVDYIRRKREASSAAVVFSGGQGMDINLQGRSS